MKTEPKIIKLAHLIEFLATSKNKSDKAEAIKAERENGTINDEEAFELALEYC